MKRYKHIRANIIVTQVGNEYINDENKDEKIPVWMVENSNDWKLIPERQWEIIGFSGVVEKNNTIKLNYSPDYLNKIGARIIKVKRISDNKIFSIGDLITWDDIGNGDYNDSVTGLNYIRINRFRFDNSTVTEDIIVNDKYCFNSILARNPKHFDDTPDFEINEFNDGQNRYFMNGNGKFTINLQYEYDVNSLLKTAKITSVIRKKDNVTFRIGDRTNFGIITGFVIDKILISPSRLKVGFSDVGKTVARRAEYLAHVEKFKPIFTTEDDVDIYKGDECWYALPRNTFEGGKFTLRKRKCNGKAVEGKYFFHKENAEKYIFKTVKIYYVVDANWGIIKTTNISSSAIYFDNEEDAKKYVDENKPQFSAKDMKDFAIYSKIISAKDLSEKSFNSWMIQRNRNNSNKKVHGKYNISSEY